jgi:hypothetical protein
MLED